MLTQTWYEPKHMKGTNRIQPVPKVKKSIKNLFKKTRKGNNGNLR